MKKRYIPFIAGGFVLFLVGGILIGMSLNKNSKNKKNNANDDPRYKIYLKAVDAGYDGTYEDWLLSIRGDEVELRVADNYIQMKYRQSTLWSNLISLDLLKGSKGDSGNDGVSIKSQLQVSNGYIQYKNENETTWSNLIAISDLTGAKGEKLELNIDNGYINYKYENDTDWTGLIELSSLTGSNGKEVIMSVESDYIVWKYDGESSWNNLVSIDTLKGNQGDKGEKSLMQVSNGFIQWKNENDTSWTNLISIETITGNNGKDITLSTDSNYIVWKYVGDEDWNNLVSLETLKGDKGNDGRGIESCEIVDGYLIITYTDGTSQNAGKINGAEVNEEILEYILLSDGTYGVRATDKGKSSAVISIPSTYEGKAVTKVLSSGFENCVILESVTLPNSITEIGDNAFNNCYSLGNITLPSNLAKIGRGSFLNCTSITELTIPESLNFIGKNAFYNSGLNKLNLTTEWIMLDGLAAYVSYKGGSSSVTGIEKLQADLTNSFKSGNLKASASHTYNQVTTTWSYNILSATVFAKCLSKEATVSITGSYGAEFTVRVYLSDLEKKQ